MATMEEALAFFFPLLNKHRKGASKMRGAGDIEEYWTTKQVVEYTGYHEEHVRRLARAGAIPCQRFGGKFTGRWAFDPETIKRWIKRWAGYWTTADVVEYTGYHRDHVRRRARHGTIPCQRIGGRWLFDPKTIKRWWAAGAPQADSELFD